MASSVTAPILSAPARKPSRRSLRGYDAVLMDVGLAGTNGAHTVGRIRALPGLAARTPIIALSGHPDADDEGVARAAGMDFYVRKPVSPTELAAALAAAVAK